MRILPTIVMLLFVPIVVYGAQPEATAKPQPKLQSNIINLSQMLSDGPAQLAPKATHIAYARLPTFDGSKEAATVVLFTVESYDLGNNYRQFLAVFFHISKRNSSRRASYNAWRLSTVTVVGHGGYRIFQSATVQGRAIELRGRSWTGKDAHCCPPAGARATYVFSPYALNKLTSKP